jgi:rhodanese-related sulfurtransferase
LDAASIVAHPSAKKADPGETMAKTITRDELRRAIEASSVTVVETLREEHFAQGHLPGAIHIHFEQIAERAPVLLPDMHAPIVTYCSNTACRNSEIAANQLAKLGYTNVRKYADGKQDWQEAGLPLVTEAEVGA